MNIIEKYAQQISELRMEPDLFLPDGIEICPAEGTRTLLQFAEGAKDWFSFVILRAGWNCTV